MSTVARGRVAAVCLSMIGGVPKYRTASIMIGAQGVQGDHHAGPFNRHKKSGDPEQNWRQVTLLAIEVLEEMNNRLKISLLPGDLGENILVRGLGHLSQLKKGDRLAIGGQVVLEVTAQNRPCDTIRRYHRSLPEEIAGKRGIAAVVLAVGSVRPGDFIEVAVGAGVAAEAR